MGRKGRILPEGPTGEEYFSVLDKDGFIYEVTIDEIKIYSLKDGGGGTLDQAQAWNTEITFDNNYGSFNENAHTQSGAIVLTIDWTGAIFGKVTSRIVVSDGNTIIFPSGAESIINNTINGTFVGRIFTPVNGERYRFVLECSDVSNEKYNLIVLDSTLYVEPTQLTAPVLTSATANGMGQIDLVFTDPNSDPQEESVEITYDTVDTFDSDPQTTTASADATTKSVTGLDNDTEYFFKVKDVGNGITTVDSEYSNTENATTEASLTILMQDDFPDTSIDTDIWNVNSPPAGIELAQTVGFLTLSVTTTAAHSYFTGVYSNSFTDNILVFNFIVDWNNLSTISFNFVVTSDADTDDSILITKSSSGYNNIRAVTKEDGSVIDSYESSVARNTRVKIKHTYSTGEVIVSYWTGSEWSILLESNIATLEARFFLMRISSSGGYTGHMSISDFYITNNDYLTETPE